VLWGAFVSALAGGAAWWIVIGRRA